MGNYDGTKLANSQIWQDLQSLTRSVPAKSLVGSGGEKDILGFLSDKSAASASSQPSESSKTVSPPALRAAQGVPSYQQKIAAFRRAFESFTLPDGGTLRPKQANTLMPMLPSSPPGAPVTQPQPQSPMQPGMPVQQEQTANVPLAQAQQQMQQFMKQPMPVAGQGPGQTGLDAAQPVGAANMPGTPGHAATNVIDRQGGLDPKGVTVDGNNAAGVPKGFKMGMMSGDELLDGLFGGAKAEVKAKRPSSPEMAYPMKQHSGGKERERPDRSRDDSELSFNSHQLNDSGGSTRELSFNSHQLNHSSDDTALLPRGRGHADPFNATAPDPHANQSSDARHEQQAPPTANPGSVKTSGDSKPVGKPRPITFEELKQIVLTPEDYKSLNNEGMQKCAYVEPMPVWRNPPPGPKPEGYDEFLQTPGAQNLLRSLGMKSEPDGSLSQLPYEEIMRVSAEKRSRDKYAMVRACEEMLMDLLGQPYEKRAGDAGDPADCEDCPHCGASMERGSDENDNGRCNQCLKRWPAKTAGAEEAIVKSVRARLEKLERNDYDTDGSIRGGVDAVWIDLGGPDGGQRAFMSIDDGCGEEIRTTWIDELLEYTGEGEGTEKPTSVKWDYEVGGPDGDGDWVKVASLRHAGAFSGVGRSHRRTRANDNTDLEQVARTREAARRKLLDDIKRPRRPRRPKTAVNRNQIDWATRLANLIERRDPDGISTAPWDVEQREKEAGIMDTIKHHAPRIRGLDSVVGTGLGAAAGLGVAGIRDYMGDNEEEDDKRYLTHALGGAAGGFAAGNLVGDRARRYMTNKLPMYGYDSGSAAQQLLPTSWQDFYDSAIADKRHIKSKNPAPHIRRELTRRSMDLPPSSQGEQPYLQSTGRKDYQPTATSGGLPGTFEHAEFSPEGWERYKSEMANVRKQPIDAAAQEAAKQGPGSGERVGQSSAGSGATDLFARHGYRWNEDGTTSMHDLWDFALTPEEKTEALGLLKEPGKLDQPLPSHMVPAPYTAGPGWAGKLDGIDQHADSRKDWLKSLLARQALQSTTNGGVVFDQKFQPDGTPVFSQ